MNDMEEWERTAMNYAGRCGGEYLDSLGKTDLALLTKAEWDSFLTIVTLRCLEKRAELQPSPF